MNNLFIKEQLKISKRQNKKERYEYIARNFNAVQYSIKLEKYNINLEKENKKLKRIIKEVKETLERHLNARSYGNHKYELFGREYLEELLDLLKEIK